jgi:hypothetical protein
VHPSLARLGCTRFTEVTIAVYMERIPDDYVSQTLFSLQALRSLSLYAHNHLANNTEFSERLELLILIAAFSVPDAAGNTLVLARSINDTTSRNQPSAARALAILKRLKR